MKKIVLLLLGVLISHFNFGQTTVWSSDFSNSSDWEIINNPTSGSLNWGITNSVPTSAQSPDLYKYWFTPLTISSFNSTSKGNFASIDGSKMGAGTRTAIIKTSQSLDLTGKQNVVLKFQQLYRRYKDSTIIEVSNDNVKWTKYLYNINKYGQDKYSTNPENVSIDISNTAGNQATVWIRFRYVGTPNDFDYAWFIDDLSVQTIPDVDASNWFSKFKTQTSKCGLVGDSIGVYIINKGVTALTNTTQIGYKINSEASVIENAVFLDIRTLQPKSSVVKGDTAIHYFSKKVDFSTPNTLYSIKVFINATNDSDHTNDTTSLAIKNYIPFDVTNSTPYSEDFESQVDPIGGFTSEKINNTGALFRLSTYGNTLVTSTGKYSIVVSAPALGVSEDWSYSRCLNLSPDYNYTLSYYTALYPKTSGPYAGKIESKLGTSNSSSTMTQSIGTIKTLTPDGKFYQVSNTFNVTNTDTYYLGFKATNTAKDSAIVLFIDDISITAKGKNADILTFGLSSPSVVGVIKDKTITLDVASNTDVTALIANFTTSPGAVVKVLGNIQNSGVSSNDFKQQVSYVVTSEDGITTNTYMIVVNVQSTPKSSEKDFLTYKINGVDGVISTANGTITVSLPAGIDLTNLVPTYSTSLNSKVTTGATLVNFSNPVVYTITAENGTTKNYTITVTSPIVKSSACDVISFAFGLNKGTIVNNVITLNLPSGSSLTQIATFVLSTGAKAKIGVDSQVSGVTSNSFAKDVVFEVTAEDGTVKMYTIKVTVAQAPVLGCKDLDNWKDGKDTVPALYPIDSTGFSGSGYFTGTGNYYFQGLHEKFENLKDGKYHKLNSVKYVFGNLVSGYDTNTVLFVGYLPDATTKLPGTTFLFSKRILVKTVASSLNSNGEFILDLSNDNIKVKGAFYAGLTIKYRQAWGTPDIFQDTIALLSNTMGVTGSTINSAYCNYRNSNKVMVYDTIMPDNARFSLGVFANVCDLSSANDLLTYNIVSPVGVVSTSGNSISIKLPLGTNPSLLTSLIANFTTSPKSTISIGQIAQVSGQTSNDFSKSIIYTITAEDGSTKDYTVVVTIEQSVKSSEKDFLTYSINGVQGSISTANNTITLTLLAGTDLTNLTAVYTTSAKSSVTSGAATVNFTNPVTYTITAEDGTTKVYTVKVTSSSTNQNTGADLLTFGFTNPNVIGVISGTNIAVSVPYGTNIKSLVASFTASTGAVVKVSNILQVNVGSVVDYTAPVTFVVTSEDGKTIKNYVVTVTITPLLSSANEMLTFGFASPTAVGTISGNTIGLTVPFGTIVTALKANFTSSPNSIVRVGPTIQVSGSTPNNFTTAQLYTVVAQDGSVKDYTVVVTISSQIGGSGSSAKDILSFGLLNPFIDGTIAGNTITITGQAGSDISKQQISFGVSPGATLTLNGVVLTTNVSIVNFSNPVTLVVVAVDGSKKEYIVTVTIPKKNGKQITFFKLLEVPSATSTIDEANKVITVHVPYGTSLSLTSVFGLSPGAKVTVGGIIQASGASQISYASNVNYVVTAEDGSTATYTVKVIIDPNTAGLEMLDNSVVRIFPNPSNGAFTCASSIETYEIIVTDILGHSVYTSRVEPNGTGTHTFDVSSFGAGVYFATIQFEGTAKMFKLEVIQ